MLLSPLPTVANSVQATKRVRQACRRRVRNIAHKTRLRTCQKQAVAAVASKDAAAAQTAYKKFVAVADAVARKGAVHANKVARIKSRLNHAIRQLDAN